MHWNFFVPLALCFAQWHRSSEHISVGCTCNSGYTRFQDGRLHFVAVSVGFGATRFARPAVQICTVSCTLLCYVAPLATFPQFNTSTPTAHRLCNIPVLSRILNVYCNGYYSVFWPCPALFAWARLTLLLWSDYRSISYHYALPHPLSKCRQYRNPSCLIPFTPPSSPHSLYGGTSRLSMSSGRIASNTSTLFGFMQVRLVDSRDLCCTSVSLFYRHECIALNATHFTYT